MVTHHEKRGDNFPSMKVPPKRKGNSAPGSRCRLLPSLNESPSEKEGKSVCWVSRKRRISSSLNESPSEKEGKSAAARKGHGGLRSLNESPSEKEGKSQQMDTAAAVLDPQ